MKQSWEAGADPARRSFPTVSDGRRKTELAGVSTVPRRHGHQPG